MFAKRASIILFFAGTLLLLTACNFPGNASNPTISPDLIYTAAAQTLTAQQTQAAQGTPVILPSVTSPSATATSPVVVVPTNTPLPPTNTPVPTNTPIPPTPTATPIPCDRGHFVKDVTIPDDTEIAAGTTFVKTWRIENNGSCTWTSGYSLVFYSGDAMSGPASAPITDGTVPPGSTVDIKATMIAPTTPGTYKGNWRLRNASGATFGVGSDAGDSFWVQIKSVQPTPTPSPTPNVNVSFDFIAKGPDATWRNATTQLSWGDPQNDDPGVAVNVANVKMEDGTTYSSLLATYPENIQDGMIMGTYPAYMIQNNDHLRTKIGLRNNCGAGNVKFQIRYLEGQSEVTVGEWVEKCDGALTSLDINLGALVGHSVKFELVVLTNGSPAGDQSLWVAPHIER